MRVKKFEAKNMKDALQMVKNELGPDAVILSARDNRKSFGIGGEASVEITAAVSESTLQKKRFVESRMTANDRQRFQNTDARTQRNIIDKMVERRVQSQQEEERPRPRPITRMSYIDIPDEEMHDQPRRRPTRQQEAQQEQAVSRQQQIARQQRAESARQQPRSEGIPAHRQAAYERAAGRNVRELLEDFEQDFEVDQWQQAPTRALSPAPRSGAVAPQSQQQAAPEAPQPVSAKALGRIRNAAREAWQAGILTDDESPILKKRPQTPPAQGGLETVAPQAPAQLQNPSVSQGSTTPPVTDVNALKGEIDRLQKMIEGFQKVPQSFVGLHPGADFGIPYDLSFMFQKLCEAGITVDHAVEMLSQAGKEIDPVQMKKKPIVDAWVARHFLSNIQTVQNPWQGRLHLFVGGAGSGKTSQLVKIASHLVVREKKKVAILSTDAFKVGAVDQLKIYCQILNVPFAVVRSRKDWEWVLGQLKHIDHVLVDMPGFQLRDLDEIHLLKSLLPPPPDAIQMTPTAHLCVSATTKDGDAYEIARRYKVTDYSDVVVTNLDQSVQHGIIYNLHKKTGKPLHSFGIGSRIPEDFEAASKERVLDLVFKLTKLRRETK